MITTLQEILQLPQNQKDALLIMAIDRLATTHGAYPDKISSIVSANFCEQANIDLDALSQQDDFNYVLTMFDKAF